MAIRPERCKKVVYSRARHVLWRRPAGRKTAIPRSIHAYSDFTKPGTKVAVMAGADTLRMMQKLGVPEDNIVTIAANADAISTVATGRADAYAATGLTASELADKSNKVAGRVRLHGSGGRRQAGARLGCLQLQQRLDRFARRLQQGTRGVQEDRRMEEDRAGLRLHADRHRAARRPRPPRSSASESAVFQPAGYRRVPAGCHRGGGPDRSRSGAHRRNRSRCSG